MSSTNFNMSKSKLSRSLKGLNPKATIAFFRRSVNSSASMMKRNGKSVSPSWSPLSVLKYAVVLPLIRTKKKLEYTYVRIHLIHVLRKFNLFKTYRRYSHDTKSNTFLKSTLKATRYLSFLREKSTTSLITRTPWRIFLFGMNVIWFVDTRFVITFSQSSS